MASTLQPEYSFIDESLVKGFTSNKKLTILLSRDGLSYTVSKISSDEVVAFEAFQFSHPAAEINSQRDLCDYHKTIIGSVEVFRKQFAKIMNFL